MSLYNALFGVNPLAGPLMMILGLTPDDVGRFRDCYPRRLMGARPTIAVLTRNGGGNRAEYESVFQKLRAHPYYLRDRDDDYDCTYASIEFRVPEPSVAFVELMLDVFEAQAPEALREPMQRFRDLQAKLEAGDKTDPDVQRALEVGKGIFGQIDDFMKTGAGGGIVKV